MSTMPHQDGDGLDGVVVATVARTSRTRGRRSGDAPVVHHGPVVGLVHPQLDHDTEALIHNNHEEDHDHHMSYQMSGSFYEDDKGMSWYKAMFLIVNAALGASLLNFPRAFHEAGGVVSGNVVHVVFTSFALGALVIIARCAGERNCKTYQELVLHMCSPGWGVVASVWIAVYCFVTCITFIIIIGDQFDRVFASYIGADFCHTWYLNRSFTMTVSSLLLIFPSCFKRIDGLRFISYVGVLSICYLVAAIVAEFYTHTYPKGPVIIYDLEWTQIFNVVPTICFGYQCHVSSVPIYSCLKQRDTATFTKACVAAILVCLVVYTVSANYGYLTFGSLVDGDILLSYDATQPLVLVANILLALKSWTTYPILLFCAREAASDLFVQGLGMTPADASVNEPMRRKVIAVVLWLVSMLLAVFTPNINVVVKLLGSLAAMFIFVFPGMCLVQQVLGRAEACGWSGLRDGWRDVCLVVVAALYLVLGMFAFGLALTLGIQHMLHPDVVKPICK